MVRFKVKRKIACIAVCLLLVSVATATANAASIYDGTYNSTVLDYASHIPIPLGDEYVFFRDTDNSYCLVVGDLHYSGGIFTLEREGRQYTIKNNTSGSYGSMSYYSYSADDIQSFNLNTNSRLVFSSVGDFPTLHERGVVYEEITLLILVIGFVCYLVRSIFAYQLRNRDK